MDLGDEEAARAAAALKQKHRKQQKKNIDKRSPLANTSTSGKDEELLQKCLELLDGLPKNSAWAKHRRAVVNKALALLRVSRSQRSQEQAKSLDDLLKSLNIS